MYPKSRRSLAAAATSTQLGLLSRAPSINHRVGKAMKVTDEMCEAAVKAALVDRIQGFTYKTHHVIRDVYKDFSEQKIWEINKDDSGADDRFYHQCRIERMRVLLEAALSTLTSG
jgi:hypothetical protein